VLVLGSQGWITPGALNALTQLGFVLRHEESAYETDGIGVSVVVASTGPDLSDLRTHPVLQEVPAVLVAVGRRLRHESGGRLASSW
jgi:hypothetical protein